MMHEAAFEHEGIRYDPVDIIDSVTGMRIYKEGPEHWQEYGNECRLAGYPLPADEILIRETFVRLVAAYAISVGELEFALDDNTINIRQIIKLPEPHVIFGTGLLKNKDESSTSR